MRGNLSNRLNIQCAFPFRRVWLCEYVRSLPRAEGHKGFEDFIEMFEGKYPNAVECLKKDWDVLLAFHDFPAEHWVHIPTTNPIESTFATVRLRHRRTKGNGSPVACLTTVFKLSGTTSRAASAASESLCLTT